LRKQELNNLDISRLTTLSPEVISRQATINIGLIGHVAHGKSTVVKEISGVRTVRFKSEHERNITIKLERLSEEEIAWIISSPRYLKKFETRLKYMLEKLKMLRKGGETSNNRNQKTTKAMKVAEEDFAYDDLEHHLDDHYENCLNDIEKQ